MSDSGLEKAYEEDLQAAAPRLGLYVDGRLKETVPDTPSGRVRIDKQAMLWAESYADVVVRRGVGDTGRHDSATPVKQRGRSESESTESPTSLRPTTRCCSPSMYAGPSGVRYRHAWSCPTAAGQPYEGRVLQFREPDRSRLARRLSNETRRYGIDDAMAAHPAAGGVLTATDERCPLHRMFGADECPECSDRRTS